MDAHSILAATAKVYRELQSLAVNIASVHESGDEGAVNHSEQRFQAYFSAPNKVRIEHPGRFGSIVVSDGVELHRYLGFPNRYWKDEIEGRDMLPGSFQPESPVQGEAFLFDRISEYAARSECLREETIGDGEGEALCHVVQVRYEAQEHPHLMIGFSPVTFWIDARTMLVLRFEGESSHRMPAHEDIRTIKMAISFVQPQIGKPLPPEMFKFIAPAGAEEFPQEAGCGSIGGSVGGSSASYGPDGRKTFETWNNHEWEGDALVERSKLRFQGRELAFERRMTLSEDGKTLRIAERITGPQGDTEREFSVPMG